MNDTGLRRRGRERDDGPAVAARRAALVLALGGLLAVLDTTVTVVALPRVVADLGTTLPVGQWITTGYLLGIVAVIPVAGWAAARWGARHTYVAAVVVFGLASLAAALAPEIGWLVAARVVQGLGGGLLNPVGQAIALRSVGRDQRGRVMALLGLPVLVGPVLGPPLSGLLVDQASWRWIFAINAPLGAAVVALCLRLVPRQAPEPDRPPLDLVGLLLLPPGATLLVVAAAEVGRDGQVGARAVLALMVALALLAVFVRHALCSRRPLVDLRLLAHGPLAHGLAVLACFGAAYFGGMSVLPVVVQGVRGDSALVAGLLTLPQAVATGLTLQVATRAVDRCDPRRVVRLGVALGAIGSLALLLAVRGEASYAVLGAAGALVGVGSGCTLMPAMTMAVRDLDGHRTPAGTTLLALGQQLASALGTAVVAVALTLLVAASTPGLDGGLEAMLALEPKRREALQGSLANGAGAAYAAVLLGMTAAVWLAARLPRGR
ncbi:DHA2 family efflux MFS transporter permease subunit [Nocardioides bruguierae]|uniref:DHA2 family efflux MFS transporter permease subunit n=1 Tax=Nocardioides bruguierae TaxID=2945102 RepID=A0A9X2D572_9ACTN|nr:DHA2 family efflux MFS transporter permease subunit [Nocardioides bruguierae]MCM0619037.1 DHA2 family efflux MFS transporter permease subunit [Nocardioides bruguierae]